MRKTNLPPSPVEEAAAARAATRIWEHGNTGNFGNQQGTSQYDIHEFEQEFEGFEVELAPENETTCEQVVQQAAAASSWWRSWW